MLDSNSVNGKGSPFTGHENTATGRIGWLSDAAERLSSEAVWFASCSEWSDESIEDFIATVKR